MIDTCIEGLRDELIMLGQVLEVRERLMVEAITPRKMKQDIGLRRQRREVEIEDIPYYLVHGIILRSQRRLSKRNHLMAAIHERCDHAFRDVPA